MLLMFELPLRDMRMSLNRKVFKFGWSGWGGSFDRIALFDKKNTGDFETYKREKKFP